MPAAEARMVPGAGHGWGPTQLLDVQRRMVEAWLGGGALPPEFVVETIGLPARSHIPAWREGAP
jgi:hypothetical protein